MNILIVGEMPLVEEVGGLCQAAGHNINLFLVEDWLTAVSPSPMVEEAATADVVIEIHDESATAKAALLRQLGKAVGEDVLILTSALATSTTEAASWVPGPGRVVGFGLLSPVGDSGLVEIAAGMRTEDKFVAQAEAFWAELGHEAVRVGDSVGLVRARTVCCLINEATSALMEGVASAADIDKAMKLGTNYPHGPLEWADMIGIDRVLGVMQGLYSTWGEDRYRPTPLLQQMVMAGKLGKKSGEGFYDY
ncbi:MAG TPA: 3-hydroxyacyl-CoA dehydrogenase family protein [Anaerolineae bacterium]|nr:3-hydroxyacyl-CoA dehydrogenase family protein [Anaerolineae bacterium]